MLLPQFLINVHLPEFDNEGQTAKGFCISLLTVLLTVQCVLLCYIITAFKKVLLQLL